MTGYKNGHHKKGTLKIKANFCYFSWYFHSKGGKLQWKDVGRAGVGLHFYIIDETKA